MGEVFARSQHGGIELLMLLAIAEHANDDGSNAYPSVPSLAAKCRTSVRYANRVLAGLRASGELQVQANGGPHGTNLYRVTLPLAYRSAPTPDLQATPGASATLTHRPPTPDLQVPDPLTYRPDEPSLNHQEPPKKTRTRPAASASDVIALLPEVEAQTLHDWLQLRKAKRAGPVTPTVAKILRSQAARAGITAQQSVEVCCGKGWQNFNASWDWQSFIADHAPDGGVQRSPEFKDCI